MFGAIRRERPYCEVLNRLLRSDRGRSTERRDPRSNRRGTQKSGHISGLDGERGKSTDWFDTQVRLILAAFRVEKPSWGPHENWGPRLDCCKMSVQYCTSVAF